MYFLMPATGFARGELYTDLAIAKRGLGVKRASEVGEYDMEALALRQRGMKFAS
jgi:hypothetical protein